MKMVTVYRAFSPADAHVIRSRLEASEFDAVVVNELSGLSIDGYSMAAGGVLVQVPEDQAEDARELINSKPPDAE